MGTELVWVYRSQVLLFLCSETETEGENMREKDSTSKITQFANKVHRPIVAAERRVQADKEFGIEARYLPLQDVWDSLTIIFLVLPLPSRNDGPSAGSAKEVWLKGCMP